MTELADDAHGGADATEIADPATVVVDDAAPADQVSDTVTAGHTGSVQVTQLGGITPTAKMGLVAEARRPTAPALPARMPPPRVTPTGPFELATVTVRSPSDDPHDQPTRLVTGDSAPFVKVEPRSIAAAATSTAMRPSRPVPRAATQNTIPRSHLDDTKPNRIDDIRLDDTKPRGQVSPAKRTLGGYRVTGVLAAGQMGVVYRGEHPSLRRAAVAIKAVQSELSTNPAVVARFFAESIVLARIDHPNVVRFHDFGYDAQGSAYLVMELLEGETLTSRLAREGKLDTSTATDIALQMSHGLAAAHKQGVIHRDIKPDNVFLCVDGTVKLLDFGVAKIDGQGPTQTLQGDLLGTAAYMAPEQGRSASESDVRSDLYSLGCVLFEMVCGVVPYPGTLVETLVAHQTAERPSARALNSEVSAELDAIIDKLLAREPADRPSTAVQVIQLLSALDSTTERLVRRDLADRSGARTVPHSKIALHAESIKNRILAEPIALGLLVTVLVLLVLLLARC